MKVIQPTKAAVPLTRRAALASCLGAVSAAACAQRAAVGYVTPAQFGAVANSPAAAQANVRAFDAMARQAIASELEIVIPKGVWYLRADGGDGSGWNIRAGRNGRCTIRGDGPDSIIRRAPAKAAVPGFSAISRART